MSMLTCAHKTYDPARDSCSECTALAPTAEEIQPGEGELAVAEAARRGLPDGFEVEGLTWRSFKDARREARECRALAAACFARGRMHLASDVMDPTAEDQARRWFAEGAKLKMAVAKAIDTQSKLIKLGAVVVQVRERIAAADRADRMLNGPARSVDPDQGEGRTVAA